MEESHRNKGTIGVVMSMHTQFKLAAEGGFGLRIPSPGVKTLVDASKNLLQSAATNPKLENQMWSIRTVLGFVSEWIKIESSDGYFDFTPDEVKIWNKRFVHAQESDETQKNTSSLSSDRSSNANPQASDKMPQKADKPRNQEHRKTLADQPGSSSADHKNACSVASALGSGTSIAPSTDIGTTQDLTLAIPESLVSLTCEIMESVGFSSVERARRTRNNSKSPQISKEIQSPLIHRPKEVVEEVVSTSLSEDSNMGGRRIRDSECDPMEFETPGGGNHHPSDDFDDLAVEEGFSCDEVQVIKNRILTLFTNYVPEVHSDYDTSKLHLVDLLGFFESGLAKTLHHRLEERRIWKEHSARVEGVALKQADDVRLLYKTTLGEHIADSMKALNNMAELQETLLSEVGTKAAEDLRAERGAYTTMKQTMAQKISDLEKQLNISKAESDKSQTAIIKRQTQFDATISKAITKVTTLNKNLDEKAAEMNVLQLDYDATLTELNELRLEQEKTDDLRDTRLLALEQELAVFRSKRFHPQTAKDDITRAVREATYDMKKEVVKACADLEKKQYEVHEKQAELDTARAELVEKTAEVKEAWEFVTEEGTNMKEKDDLIKSMGKRLEEPKELSQVENFMLTDYIVKATEVVRLRGELAKEQVVSAELEGTLLTTSDSLRIERAETARLEYKLRTVTLRLGNIVAEASLAKTIADPKTSTGW